MSDWPTTLLPPLKIITPYSMDSLGESMFTFLASATVVQNQAYYFPFRMDVAATAVKMFTFNGATANGNLDVGIYDGEFNRIVSSGSTLQSGTSALQEFNITDTLLNPGLYWMAFASDSTTATILMASSGDEVSQSLLAPCYIQSSAFALPATATPVKSSTTLPIYAAGIGVSFDTLI